MLKCGFKEDKGFGKDRCIPHILTLGVQHVKRAQNDFLVYSLSRKDILSLEWGWYRVIDDQWKWAWVIQSLMDDLWKSHHSQCGHKALMRQVVKAYSLSRMYILSLELGWERVMDDQWKKAWVKKLLLRLQLLNQIGINPNLGHKFGTKSNSRSIKKQERGRERRWNRFSRWRLLARSLGAASHLQKASQRAPFGKACATPTISKSMVHASLFFGIAPLETPAQKRSYLELRWSKLLNPGLKWSQQASLCLCEYLLHASFLFILFYNSIFACDLCLRRRDYGEAIVLPWIMHGTGIARWVAGEGWRLEARARGEQGSSIKEKTLKQ